MKNIKYNVDNELSIISRLIIKYLVILLLIQYFSQTVKCFL